MKVSFMAWKFPFFGRKDETPGLKEKTYDYDMFPQGSLEEFIIGSGTNVSAKKALEFYRSSSAVAIAVDMIADEVEKINPVLVMEDGTIDESHEILDFINQPNGFESREEFIAQIARNWLLTHDSVFYTEGSENSPPIAAWAVKAQAISITANRDTYPDAYGVTNGPANGNYRRNANGSVWRFQDTPLREVYQIRGFSSNSENTFSDSPLLACVLEVRQQLEGKNHNLKLVENGARLSMIATFKDIMTRDGQKAAIQLLRETFSGSNNAGKIAVAFGGPGGVDYQEAGMNNKDMDYATIETMSSQSIAQRYKIPLPLWTNDASTFNNMDTATKQFFKSAVLPCFSTIYSGIGKNWLPRYKLDPAKVTISYNPNDIDSIRKEYLEELRQKFDMRAISTNEIRDKISLEPKEGGDEIFVPSTMMPMDSDFSSDMDNMSAQEAAESINGNGN